MSIMTSMGKKGLSGVAQDFAADGSPSFADLVCTQNQNAKLQTEQLLPLARTNKAAGVQNMEPEFEFQSTTDDSTKATPNSNAPAKVLFHKGRVLSQSVLSKSSQPQALEETSLKEILSPAQKNSRRSNTKESNLNKGTTQPCNQVKRIPNKKHGASGQWFGRKIFQTFAKPCRTCHASEPTASAKGQISH